jgi:quercetin dioxygenase-like cupin family protein
VTRMHKMAGTVTVAVVVATLGVVAQQPAPQTGFRRTPVQQGDLTVPGREVVQALAEIQPGAESGRHTHPGEEVGYVLEGTIAIDVQGTVHNARNTGKTAAKVLATYIIEKGKPPATPVQ